MSGDEAMIRELTGGDIHANTARTIYKRVEEDVSPAEWKNMRNLAKTVGFGSLYGLAAQGLILRTPSLDLTIEEAQAFIDGFYSAYPGLREWQAEIIRFTRKYGYAETISGRRRYIPDINASLPKYRSEAERQAINHPVQGSAADFFKVSTNNVRDFLISSGLRSRLIAQVHDELIIEAPEDELDVLAENVPGIMGTSYELAVPVPVDFEYGKSWGKLKVYEKDES